MSKSDPDRARKEYERMDKRLTSAVECMDLALSELGDAWEQCKDPDWRKAIRESYMKIKEASELVGWQ